MAALDLTEIPSPRGETASSDRFELFAREFLEYRGFTVVSSVSRGPDGGKDLIVAEERRGVGGVTTRKWLVSCKHFAHSGKSVGVGEDQNIKDRLAAHSCDGFLAFYSPLPSTGLADRLDGLSTIEVLVYDGERIERELLASPEGVELARRFFPESVQRFQNDHPAPVPLFSDLPDVTCAFCNKDLLDPPSGIVVVWNEFEEEERTKSDRIVALYTCCKGACDRALEQRTRAAFPNQTVFDGWEDIPDICIPQVYVKWVIGTMSRLHEGEEYEPKAFDQLRSLLLALARYAVRPPTQSETEVLDRLYQIPSYLGGMG